MEERVYSNQYSTFKEGVVACIPTIMGYLGIGIAVGVVGKSMGLSVAAIVFMSILVYGGSSQFVIAGMLMSSSPIYAIVFTTFLINLRHFLMSLSVADYFKDESFSKSIGIGTLLTDESYGVLMTAILTDKSVSFKWISGLNITAYIVWVFSTLLGSLLGDLIPDPNKLGLDFSLMAMFIGLVILQVTYPLIHKTKQTVIILLSVVGSLYVFTHIFSPELSVLLAMLIGCMIGVVTDDGDI
ncbi:MAG: AzlC family ABC transporter permease [Vagococcus sp.]